MKATIKNGMLVDNEGFTLYPNRVYQYGAAFKDILEGYPDGTEVNIKNVWDHKTLYCDDARILYGSCLDFSFAEPIKSVEESVEQEVIINDPTIVFGKGRDNNDCSRDNSNVNECSVSSSGISSSVQDEHGTVSEDAGNN